MKQTESERFWLKVDKTDSCWLWTGAKSRTGYGRFRYTGRHEYAHRVAYRLTYGNINKGMFVLHKCDNPSCVRPDHLFLGTLSDNNNDSVSKGRWGDRSMRGNKHAEKKVPDEIVRIVMENKTDNTTRLANRLGYSWYIINKIKLHNKYAKNGG